MSVPTVILPPPAPPETPVALSSQSEHWARELAESLEFEHHHHRALIERGGPGSRQQVAECLGRILWAQAELARLGVVL